MADVIEKFDLFPYQKEGAKLLFQNERFGLHDEMGIGKTATTIGAVDLIFEAQGSARGLIICPAMLRQNWINEFRKFSKTGVRVLKGQTIHDFVSWQRGRFDVLVTSYEMATRWRTEFLKNPEFLDFLALDEAHFVKHYKTARTAAVFGRWCNLRNCWSSYAVRVFHITGTPMSNDVFDIYPFLRLTGEVEGTPAAFASQYFVSVPTPWGAKLEPSKSAVERLKIMVDRNRIARTLTDIGMQLPPIVFSERLVDGDTKPIIEMLRAEPGLEEAIRDAINNGGLSRLDAHHVMTLRRLIGTAKAVPYAKMLAEELAEGDEKHVVFCCHTDPAMTLVRALEKAKIRCVFVNGQTPEEERQRAVRDFQNPEKDIRVFIGNMRVAGTGLTLTAASRVHLLESDWTPAGNAQALKRLHRYGQTANRVLAQFVTLANSLDVSVNASLRRKTAVIAAVDGRRMLPETGKKRKR